MTLTPAKNGTTLAAPYGPSPVTTEAQQLTQQLFQFINSERAACGLPPFAWNGTLASGALLHSWNMYHCGFSHTCPDGSTPFQRIANEGYAGYPDCVRGGAAELRGDLVGRYFRARTHAIRDRGEAQ